MSGGPGRRLVVDRGGVRADVFVAQATGSGRKAVALAFGAGLVRVNGRRAHKGDALAVGDTVDIDGPLAEDHGAAPAPEPDLPLEFVYTDPRLVVVVKPAGWATHPLARGERGSLAGAVVARFPECAHAAADGREGGACHRLDRGTSGLVAFARDLETWARVRAAFSAGRVDKRYLALVAGRVDGAGSVRQALRHGRGRDAGRVLACADNDDGALAAVSDYTPLRTDGERTLLEVRPHTGRMHQIRVHLAGRGWPIVGDQLYGGPPAPPGFVGHYLHAAHLGLPEMGVVVGHPPAWVTTWAGGA